MPQEAGIDRDGGMFRALYDVTLTVLIASRM